MIFTSVSGGREVTNIWYQTHGKTRTTSCGENQVVTYSTQTCTLRRYPATDCGEIIELFCAAQSMANCLRVYQNPLMLEIVKLSEQTLCFVIISTSNLQNNTAPPAHVVSGSVSPCLSVGYCK